MARTKRDAHADFGAPAQAFLSFTEWNMAKDSYR